MEDLIRQTCETLKEAVLKGDQHKGDAAVVKLMEIAMLDIHRIADALEILSKPPG